ncbi:MAG: hypothetical protein ACYDBB_10700 [Armatimonadota bacterium]
MTVFAIFAVLVGLSLLTRKTATPSFGPGQNDLCLAVNTFSNEVIPGSKLNLLVALGYDGQDASYYFDTGDTSIEFGVGLYDNTGTYIVKPGFHQTPPPPPPDWYVEKEGKRTFVVPVQRMQKSEVKALILEDTLKSYPNLKSGSYYIKASLQVGIYKKNDVFERADTAHKYWAVPSKAITRFELESNAVPITITEVRTQ